MDGLIDRWSMSSSVFERDREDSSFKCLCTAHLTSCKFVLSMVLLLFIIMKFLPRLFQL